LWGFFSAGYVSPSDAVLSVSGSTFGTNVGGFYISGDTVILRGMDSAQTVFQTPESNSVIAP